MAEMPKDKRPYREPTRGEDVRDALRSIKDDAEYADYEGMRSTAYADYHGDKWGAGVHRRKSMAAADRALRVANWMRDDQRKPRSPTDPTHDDAKIRARIKALRNAR